MRGISKPQLALSIAKARREEVRLALTYTSMDDLLKRMKELDQQIKIIEKKIYAKQD